MKLLVVIFAALLAAIGLFVQGLNESERQERQRDQEWRQYSQEHNCVVERDQSFWNAATTWKCDGGHFEVRR